MIVLGLGTNVGDRQQNLARALQILKEEYEVEVKAVSSIYETAPFGVTDQADFLNMTAVIATELSPGELLKACLDVEQAMGRVRGRRWGPRIIDIDLLLYDDVNMAAPDLTLPHPGILQRGFVLIPLREIAPGLLLSDGRTVAEAAEDFSGETNSVRPWKQVQ